MAEQPLVQEPDAARVKPSRLCPDKIGNIACLYSKKQSLQYSEIEPFILEGEGNMSFESGFGCMSWRIDAPALFLRYTVPFPDGT
jgi:hypothetical protein